MATAKIEALPDVTIEVEDVNGDVYNITFSNDEAVDLYEALDAVLEDQDE